MTSIAIGADHAGFQAKQEVVHFLREQGYEVLDVGTDDEESCDYPDFAKLVASALVEKKAQWGILICGTGIGMAITANRFAHVRAALCYDRHTAEVSRQHNDSNVLCLGGRKHSHQEIKDLVSRWLNTEFEGGRHQRRVRKIDAD